MDQSQSHIALFSSSIAGTVTALFKMDGSSYSHHDIFPHHPYPQARVRNFGLKSINVTYSHSSIDRAFISIEFFGFSFLEIGCFGCTKEI